MPVPITIAAARESALQRVLMAWIVTGLAFMLLPGTFLGVWNLISIAGSESAGRIDPAWIQAHGHAQIFGWIGSFILGIGFYSLTKMGGSIPEFAVSRAWISWALWTVGVALRWATNVWQWYWRWTLPISAALEMAGFLLFFITVRGHRTEKSEAPAKRPAWMILVMAGSIGFMLSLVVNTAAAIQSSVSGITPAISHALDQRILVLFTWAFPVLTIWGFSARWLPVFLGLSNPVEPRLFVALAINAAAVAVAMLGWWPPATAAFLVAAALACSALNVFTASLRPPKTGGIHSSFPFYVRLAYGWLIVSAFVGVSASMWDRAGGLWGASRHALTVGFMSTMVFAIGQRVLPAFTGMRMLYSPALMFWSLLLLNVGCFLRVAAEIGAYESYALFLWPVLPVSALIEMAAVTLFAANLLLTFPQEPPHVATLAGQQR